MTGLAALHAQARLGLDPAGLTPETRLADLDLDALDWVELAITAEQRFGITRPEDMRPRTVADLAAAIAAAPHTLTPTGG